MKDQEILDKYKDLENSYLTEKEKKEVMEMLYRCKEAFCLWDEIGMSQHRSRNRCHGQIPIFYQTVPCKGGR